MKKSSLLYILVIFAFLLASCKPAAEVEAPAAEEAEAGSDKMLVYGIFATPIEVPWPGAINRALVQANDAGDIEYHMIDNAGNATDYARVLRQVATEHKPALVVGDSTGQEELVREITAEFPDIAFAMASNYGPTPPNLSVFDNYVQEPAYLCGMLAGGLTETGKVGVVAALPIPEVNRVVNGFISGVKATNPEAQVYVSFINSFFDPGQAKDNALAQIDAGVDVLFAERAGVIEAAAENGLWAFGYLVDQNDQAPEYVLTGPIWDMSPTINHLVEEVKAGSYTAQDLKEFSMMTYGGAYLAPFHGLDSKVPEDLMKQVKDMEAKLKSGTARVDLNENQPQAVN